MRRRSDVRDHAEHRNLMRSREKFEARLEEARRRREIC